MRECKPTVYAKPRATRQTPKSTSMKARRKLVLDGGQGTARAKHSMYAPEICSALGDNVATEQQRTCTPTKVHEKHASNIQFRRAETRLMRSKQHQNKTTISGHQGEAAGQNTASRDQQTPPAFEKHVAVTLTKTPAGKRTRDGILEAKVAQDVKKHVSAARRKLTRSQVRAMVDCRSGLEQNGSEEADSSEICVAPNRGSTERRKPSEIGGCRRPKSTARAGPSASQSRGSESSDQDSKPAARRTKALQEIAAGRAARKRNHRAGAPTVVTPDKVACDDMYQFEDLAAGGIPDHLFEGWERLSDVLIPTMGTPLPNTPHLSPGRVQYKRGVKPYRV